MHATDKVERLNSTLRYLMKELDLKDVKVQSYITSYAGGVQMTSLDSNGLRPFHVEISPVEMFVSKDLHLEAFGEVAEQAYNYRMSLDLWSGKLKVVL